MHGWHKTHQARFFPGRPENQTARGSDGAEGGGQARRGVVEQLGFPFFNRAVVGLEHWQTGIIRPVLRDPLTVGGRRCDQQTRQLAVPQQLRE
ncbi:hypothetical protein D3C81_1962290 [compost metagenome]